LNIYTFFNFFKRLMLEGTQTAKRLNRKRLAIGIGTFIVLIIVWRVWQGPTVNTYRVVEQPLIQNVVATGRVISTSRAQIGAEITGVVLERHITEGDRVKPGDLLITLRADDLAARVREAQAALDQLRTSRRPQAMAALKQAQAQLEQTVREAKRRRDLYQSESISKEIYEKAEQALILAKASEEQSTLLSASLAPGASEELILIERLNAAQATLARTEIKAHVSGIVLTRDVVPGDIVQPGRQLLEIAKEGSTEILIPVDERNLGVLALGQPARCIADAYPSQPFNARINFIAPTIDPQRGTVDVRLTVEPPPEFLRQDMTVTATIQTNKRDKAITVSNDLIKESKDGNGFVWLVRDGRVVAQPVKLGLRGLSATEITDGLKPGDPVILSATVKIGERVRSRNVD
jgi:HlyD family secretion protein